MRHAEFTRRAGGSLLLATSFVIALSPSCAQTPAVLRSGAPRSARSESADAIRIQQDEARLLALLAIHPDDPGALAGMAWVRSRQKNYTAAISYLEHARQKRPDDHNLEVALEEARFHVLLAEAQTAAHSNDVDAAQKFYSQALAIHPHSPEVLAGLHGLGAARAQAGKAPAPRFPQPAS